MFISESRKRTLAMLKQDSLEGDDEDHSSDDQMEGTRRRKKLCTPLDDEEEELGRIMRNELELEENDDDEGVGENLIQDVD